MKIYVVRYHPMDGGFTIAAFHMNLAAAKRCADHFADEGASTQVVEMTATHDFFPDSIPPDEKIVYEGRF